jgi:hypothetical protein
VPTNDELVVYRLDEMSKRLDEHLARSEKSAEQARKSDAEIITAISALRTGLALTEQRVKGNSRTIAAMTSAVVSVAVGAGIGFANWLLRKGEP